MKCFTKESSHGAPMKCFTKEYSNGAPMKCFNKESSHGAPMKCFTKESSNGAPMKCFTKESSNGAPMKCPPKERLPHKTERFLIGKSYTKFTQNIRDSLFISITVLQQVFYDIFSRYCNTEHPKQVIYKKGLLSSCKIAKIITDQ